MSSTTVQTDPDSDRPRATSIPIVAEAHLHAWDEDYVRPRARTHDDGTVIVAGDADLPLSRDHRGPSKVDVRWQYDVGSGCVMFVPDVPSSGIALYLGDRLAVAAALERLAAQLRYDPPEIAEAARAAR
ncbi:MAG: hypothetical protein M0P31_15305 [Solirubrobacteraceae bacterium]|nr:hypothetical protein [Solirubrobacteraceae bacterium]